MANFSERYGYAKPSSIIIREEITEEIQNGICNCYFDLKKKSHSFFHDLEDSIWSDFLFYNMEDRSYAYSIIAEFICDDEIDWYEKLDLIEYTLPIIKRDKNFYYDEFIHKMNSIFERLNFAYRIISDEIVEINNLEEIKSITEALETPINGVRVHLQTALKLLSSSQDTPDYRNSIKESISAVECCCRDFTGKTTLDDALKNLESKGIKINSQMKKGFENLYYYTNDKRTGIRHAFMDEENEPTADEAIFMLVSCSAFVNYITKKKDKINEE